MAIMQIFKPTTGCRIYASEQHYAFDYLTHSGVVIEVAGNIIHFKSLIHGDTDSMVWRFSDGNNKHVIFGA